MYYVISLLHKSQVNYVLWLPFWAKNRDFFPKLNESLSLQSFADIAERYLLLKGYKAFSCVSESEAREKVHQLLLDKTWPCVFTTTVIQPERKALKSFMRAMRAQTISIYRYGCD